MRVQLLGPLVVTINGATASLAGPMDRALLAHLTLAEGRSVSVSSLVDALWPDSAPVSARNALQVKISRLRKGLSSEAGRLQYTKDSYRLQLEPGAVDAERLRTLVHTGRESLATGDPASARTAFAAAVALWRGEPLPDLWEYPDVRQACERFRELWFLAREGLAEACIASSYAGTTVEDLRQMLADEPLRPKPRLLLMEALDRAGRRADALAVYDVGRRLFASETGLEPPEDMRMAFERMLNAERDAASRQTSIQEDRPPSSELLRAAKWLADEGDPEGALRLAVRGAWWWWSGEYRAEGRELLNNLLKQAEVAGIEGQPVLRAQAWAGALGLGVIDNRWAFDESQAALATLGQPNWDDRDALVGALTAERLFQHGRHVQADALLVAARAVFERRSDKWGVAICEVSAARRLLVQGDAQRAERTVAGPMELFARTNDSAGQLLALDVLGYAAEVRGHHAEALGVHEQALAISRRCQSPEWEAKNLARLGSLKVLAEHPEAVQALEVAVDCAKGHESRAMVAFANNGLGVGLAIVGDLERSADCHRNALAWYAEAESHSGVAYSKARLGLVLHHADPEAAAAQAMASLGPALVARDPRGVAHSLEAVAVATSDQTVAARALIAARELRMRTGGPLRGVEGRAVVQRSRDLVDQEVRVRASHTPLSYARFLADSHS